MNWKSIAIIMQDILVMIYQYSCVSIILSLLIIIVWKQAEKTSWVTVGKEMIGQLKSQMWRQRIIAVLYLIFVLQRTVFNRSPIGNPLWDILGSWELMIDGMPNYEVYENIILFFPVHYIVRTSNIDKYIKHWNKHQILSVVLIPMECSVIIEMIQLMTRAGTFQLSDIVYNTIGGIIGSIFYWIASIVSRKKEDRRNSDE